MKPRFHGEPDAEDIAAAVHACPSVAGLSGGRFGYTGTYLPGRRVPGVRIDNDVVTVHVIGVFGPPIVQIAAEVVVATAPHAVGRRVDVVVEDLTGLDASTPIPPGSLVPPFVQSAGATRP